jgi:hypothetical protein
MSASTKPVVDLIIAAGLEAAFIGVGLRHGQAHVAVYSLSAAVDILEEGGMSREDARNLLYDHVRDLDFGEASPVWVEEMSVDELRLLTATGPTAVH